MAKLRPKYLDLFQIHLPIPGIVSILHRISGAVLFLFLPLLLYWFQSSLAGPEEFGALSSETRNPLIKLVLIGLLWAFLHHLCAGIRHVLLDLDLDIGTELAAARFSSKLVLTISVALAVVMGALLW